MPRDQLYQRKVPVMLTDAQVAWLDDYRFANRFEGRSEAIRALIDQARDFTAQAVTEADPLGRIDAPAQPPPVPPFDLDAYPGQGLAPKLVPFLIRTARRSYTEDELVTELGMVPASIETGKLASIRNTMKSAGFRASSKRLPGQSTVKGWEYG